MDYDVSGGNPECNALLTYHKNVSSNAIIYIYTYIYLNGSIRAVYLINCNITK